MTTENEQAATDGGTEQNVTGTEALIRKYTTITAAMELLPDALASVGILPLQLRLVYLVGKSHGYELDTRHTLELLTTFGIGMAAQGMESTVRKLVGLGGPLGIAAAASATFGITYALGKVADHYYGHGRTLALDSLQNKFVEYKNQARGLYELCKEEVAQLGKTGNPAAATGARRC